MSSSRTTEKERQTAAVLLVVFASLLFAAMILEVMLITNSDRNTLWTDFVSKSSLSFVMPYFLAYLVIGGAGLAGTVGLILVYGQGVGYLAELTRLAALAYFTISYWLWSAVWIVEHKLTLLAETPTDPPEWVLNAYAASDALWALPSWGSLGPAIGMFSGLAWLLWRGARLLPRAAAVAFGLMAASRFLSLIYVGITGGALGNTGDADFAFYNDAAFNVGRIVAFLLAAAALVSEKGVFSRSSRVG